MTDGRGGLRLAGEPGEVDGALLDQRVERDLDRDDAIQREIGAAVHGTHAAAPDHLVEPVAPRKGARFAGGSHADGRCTWSENRFTSELRTIAPPLA